MQGNIQFSMITTGTTEFLSEGLPLHKHIVLLEVISYLGEMEWLWLWNEMREQRISAFRVFFVFHP